MKSMIDRSRMKNNLFMSSHKALYRPHLSKFLPTRNIIQASLKSIPLFRFKINTYPDGIRFKKVISDHGYGTIVFHLYVRSLILFNIKERSKNSEK